MLAMESRALVGGPSAALVRAHDGVRSTACGQLTGLRTDKCLIPPSFTEMWAGETRECIRYMRVCRHRSRCGCVAWSPRILGIIPSRLATRGEGEGIYLSLSFFSFSLSLYIYICLCIYIYLSLCVYIYIYLHTELDSWLIRLRNIVFKRQQL